MPPIHTHTHTHTPNKTPNVDSTSINWFLFLSIFGQHQPLSIIPLELFASPSVPLHFLSISILFDRTVKIIIVDSLRLYPPTVSLSASARNPFDDAGQQQSPSFRRNRDREHGRRDQTERSKKSCFSLLDSRINLHKNYKIESNIGRHIHFRSEHKIEIKKT